jgi:hypothetical protein
MTGKENVLQKKRGPIAGLFLSGCGNLINIHAAIWSSTSSFLILHRVLHHREALRRRGSPAVTALALVLDLPKGRASSNSSRTCPGATGRSGERIRRQRSAKSQLRDIPSWRSRRRRRTRAFVRSCLVSGDDHRKWPGYFPAAGKSARRWKRFKQSGKEVFAVSNSIDPGPYYSAAHRTGHT